MSGIRFTLADDPKAKEIYDKLLKDGVKQSDVDRGYYDMSMAERELKPELVGKGDGEITPQEVYGYVLAHYGQYKKTLQLKTGIFSPFATYYDEQMSERLRIFERSVDDLVEFIEKKLRGKGIDRSSDKFYALSNDAIIIAFYDPKPEDGVLVREKFKKEGLSSLIPQLVKMGRKIKGGSRECKSVMPLVEHVDNDCIANDFSIWNMSILTFLAADLRPSGYLVKDAETGILNIEHQMTKDDGTMIRGVDDKESWVLSDARCVLGFYYFLGNMLSRKYDDDSEGRWISKARLLLPESSIVRVEYARWLINRPNPDYDSVLDELHIALRLNPWNKFAFYFGAITLYKMGEIVRSISALEKALKIDPEFEPARETLDWLNKELAKIKTSPSEDALKQAIQQSTSPDPASQSKPKPKSKPEPQPQPVVPNKVFIFEQRDVVPPLIRFGKTH